MSDNGYFIAFKTMRKEIYKLDLGIIGNKRCLFAAGKKRG